METEQHIVEWQWIIEEIRKYKFPRMQWKWKIAYQNLWDTADNAKRKVYSYEHLYERQSKDW
jgi:hypothetical protein